ncbi:unnamed protein product, partial [Strongylus vulgaris]
MVFCDLRRDQCVSRIMKSATCSETFENDPCYASECVQGVCVSSSKSEDVLKEHPRRKIAERAVPVKNEPIMTEITTSTMDPVANLLDLVEEEQLSDGYNMTVVQDNSTE